MDILNSRGVIVKRVHDPDYPDDMLAEITFTNEATAELFNWVGNALRTNAGEDDLFYKTYMQTHTTFKVKDEYKEEDKKLRAQAQIHFDNIQRDMMALRELGQSVYITTPGYTTPMEWRTEIAEVANPTTGKYELECPIGGKLHTALRQHGLIE